MQCLHLLHKNVLVWPPPHECQQAAHKLLIIHYLDEIASSIIHSPRPITTLWRPGDQLSLLGVVLKREGSDCGRHIYPNPTCAPQTPQGDEAHFAWFTQTRIETLRSVGEWRVVITDMQVICVVNTMPLDMRLSETYYSQCLYGLSLEEMR